MSSSTSLSTQFLVQPLLCSTLSSFWITTSSYLEYRITDFSWKLGPPSSFSAILIHQCSAIATACHQEALPRVIQATAMTGNLKGENAFIPRIPILASNLLFEFFRATSFRSGYILPCPSTRLKVSPWRSPAWAFLNPAFLTANSTWDVPERDHQTTSSLTLPMKRPRTLSTWRLCWLKQ